MIGQKRYYVVCIHYVDNVLRFWGNRFDVFGVLSVVTLLQVCLSNLERVDSISLHSFSSFL